MIQGKNLKMKLVFFFNYLNHHQSAVADALFAILGSDDFAFIGTAPPNEAELKGGKDYSDRPYYVNATSSAENGNWAIELAKNAEVCVFGALSQQYAIIRAKYNPCGLSLEISERWLKRGLLNMLSPNFIKWVINYWKFYRKANFKKLCSSGFVRCDDEKIGAYRDCHFKWGYFTDVLQNLERDYNCKRIKLMWCARFLKLKHPELPILMASRLKRLGYEFHLDMYGIGPEEHAAKLLVTRYNLDDSIKFHGQIPNEDVLRVMQQTDIFLFTSDRQEGWGAVANESMASGCAIVSSDTIGSTPFLIKDGITGFKFKSGDVASLTQIVSYLLDHPDKIKQIGQTARDYMSTIWSPKNAARSLLTLISDLQNGRVTSISEGPCSKA